MNNDNIIEKLLSVRGNKPGNQVALNEDNARNIFENKIIGEDRLIKSLSFT